MTAIHLDRFHLDAALLETRVVTWGWLAVYWLVPIWMAVIAVGLWRRRHLGPPMRMPLPRLTRASLALQVVVFTLHGRRAPARAAARGARLAVGADPADRPRDRRVAGRHRGLPARRRCGSATSAASCPALATYLAFAVLQGVALLRFTADVAWGSPRARGRTSALLALAGATAAGTLWAARTRWAELTA